MKPMHRLPHPPLPIEPPGAALLVQRDTEPGQRLPDIAGVVAAQAPAPLVAHLRDLRAVRAPEPREDLDRIRDNIPALGFDDQNGFGADGALGVERRGAQRPAEKLELREEPVDDGASVGRCVHRGEGSPPSGPVKPQRATVMCGVSCRRRTMIRHSGRR